MRKIPPPQMEPIRRGTTPTLRLDTPYPAELIRGGYITFSQRGSVLYEKKFDDEVVKVYDNLVSVELSQAETLVLTPVDVCKIQMRFIFKHGKTASSGVYKIPVEDTLKGGEIYETSI